MPITIGMLLGMIKQLKVQSTELDKRIKVLEQSKPSPDEVRDN